MFYIAKMPTWVQKLFTGYIWEMPKAKKTLYLTFDDGPHPVVTPFVLNELEKWNAKATFFCIGKNVVDNPLIFNQIKKAEHAIGNHTYDHLDGWKTENSKYLQNILKAKEQINSVLFRPPYGRITRKQYKALTQLNDPFKIIMWSVLSGDFDINISPEQCANNVLQNATSGSVIVFHDSEKASERLRYALPAVLKYFSEKGYVFEKIVLNS